MTKQPEALLLADDLVEIGGESSLTRMLAAGELRRLHEVNQELLEALNLTNIDCQHLHHAYKDRHTLSEACPVVDRINTAIAKAGKQQ